MWFDKDKSAFLLLLSNGKFSFSSRILLVRNWKMMQPNVRKTSFRCSITKKCANFYFLCSRCGINFGLLCVVFFFWCLFTPLLLLFLFWFIYFFAHDYVVRHLMRVSVVCFYGIELFGKEDSHVNLYVSKNVERTRLRVDLVDHYY